MSTQQLLDIFISRLAKKIANLYPSNCADEEDYIQTGHLKLIEINKSKHRKHNFQAYAIIAIARAMRESALEVMGIIYAPKRIKKLAYQIKLLLIIGKTEQEVCDELKIDMQTFINLKLLTDVKSWHKLFDEPTHDPKPFSAIDDLLSSCRLTEENRNFLLTQLENDMSDLELTPKQKWSQKKYLRPRLIRSGYGI